MSKLEGDVAEALIAEASELVDRWRMNTPSVAPRAGEQPPAGDLVHSAQVVEIIAGALRNDPGCYDAVMRMGWRIGGAAHVGGTSLHYLLKELGLLEALVLYACERALRHAAPGEGAADGMALARRLHRFFRVLTEAAVKGFTSDYVEDLQDQYRILRHDLRNPLGTIRSAVSLMDDETVPMALRDGPRIRQIMTRNAASLDQVIGKRLSDAATQESSFTRQEVVLRGVALGVRRELRDEMAEAGCDLVVSDSLPTLEVDSTALELALKSVVAGVAQLAAVHTDITIELAESPARSAVLQVTFQPDPVRFDRGALMRSVAFGCEVLEAAGGGVVVDERSVRLTVPVLAGTPPGGVPVPPSVPVRETVVAEPRETSEPR